MMAPRRSDCIMMADSDTPGILLPVSPRRKQFEAIVNCSNKLVMITKIVGRDERRSLPVIPGCDPISGVAIHL